MAVERRQPVLGCIHHSDRGVQYACGDYIRFLESNGFNISMSRKGNPYDNAAMESFMKTMKYNEVYLKNYDTLTDVLRHLPYFIEEVYNKKWLHSSLGYLTPQEFEVKFNKKEEIGSPKLLVQLIGRSPKSNFHNSSGRKETNLKPSISTGVRRFFPIV